MCPPEPGATYRVDGAIVSDLGLADEFDTGLAINSVVALKIVCAREEEYSAAGLIAYIASLMIVGCPRQQDRRRPFAPGLD